MSHFEKEYCKGATNDTPLDFPWCGEAICTLVLAQFHLLVMSIGEFWPRSERGGTRNRNNTAHRLETLDTVLDATAAARTFYAQIKTLWINSSR